jgi:hypothetical protein
MNIIIVSVGSIIDQKCSEFICCIMKGVASAFVIHLLLQLVLVFKNLLGGVWVLLCSQA